MIVATTEGIPYTSIHLRADTYQTAVGVLGLFLLLVGIYLGFDLGKNRKYSARRTQTVPGG